MYCEFILQKRRLGYGDSTSLSMHFFAHWELLLSHVPFSGRDVMYLGGRHFDALCRRSTGTYPSHLYRQINFNALVLGLD